MNDDSRFARARIRAQWQAMEDAGLSRERIAAAAAHLARVRDALDAVTDAFFVTYTRPGPGDAVLVDGGALAAMPREIGLRVVAALLGRVGGAAYRPRFERLESALCGARAAKPGGAHLARLPRRPRTETCCGISGLGRSSSRPRPGGKSRRKRGKKAHQPQIRHNRAT